MEVLGLDHVELYVADLEDAVGIAVQRLGLVPTGRNRLLSDISTGTSVSFACGSTSVVLTAPFAGAPGCEVGGAGGRVEEFLSCHGAGVANICLRTTEVSGVWNDAIAGGAEACGLPYRDLMNGESATVAAVQAFGDVWLTFIARSNPRATRPFGFTGIELPDAGEQSSDRVPMPDAFEGIDHLAVCLPPGELDATAAYYTDVLGFVRSFEERVSVSGQAMDSIVVQDRLGALVLTLLCQDPDRKPGQISRFVDAHGGAGVQHVAFRTGDVLGEVERLRGSVDFLAIPPAYYRQLLAEPAADRVEVSRLEQAGVLRDRDAWGTILQTFTRSPHPRDTLFFELVERRGARTFGSGNIKALYEAVGRVEPVDTAVTSPGGD